MNRFKFLLTFTSLIPFFVSAKNSSRKERKVGGPCDGCELIYEGMPQNLSWQTTIVLNKEPGEVLAMTGTIYKKDGRTPAPNVILYVYHTDAKGYYSPSSNQILAKRHGHLRGWMKTDVNGRYQFKTIRPAAYPERNMPEHIHPVIKEEGLSEYYIDEYVFDDDPLLTSKERAKTEKRGGSGIITLSKNSKGEWLGKRDIILGMNIPGY